MTDQKECFFGLKFSLISLLLLGYSLLLRRMVLLSKTARTICTRVAYFFVVGQCDQISPNGNNVHTSFCKTVQLVSYHHNTCYVLLLDCSKHDVFGRLYSAERHMLRRKRDFGKKICQLSSWGKWCTSASDIKGKPLCRWTNLSITSLFKKVNLEVIIFRWGFQN